VTASRAKRHHLVAQSYLRRFADKREMVTVLDKRDGREFSANIKNVAVEADFYTLEENGEKSDAFEQFMATDVEGPAVSAFDRLTAEQFPPTTGDREVIAKFIGLQLVRGVAFREMHDRLAQAQAARKIPPRNEMPPEVFAELERAAIEQFLALATSQKFRIETMITMAEKVVPLLMQRPWFLARTADAPTSDSPVIPWIQKTKQAGFGIGVAAADEIAMPVSPELVLVLGPRVGSPVGEQVIEGPAGWQKQFPDLVRGTARRYVYRRPGTSLGVSSKEPSRP